MTDYLTVLANLGAYDLSEIQTELVAVLNVARDVDEVFRGELVSFAKRDVLNALTDALAALKAKVTSLPNPAPSTEEEL